MAQVASLKAKTLSKQDGVHPQLILEIEGIDLIFGIHPVLEIARWDSGIRWDEDGVRWDGLIESEKSRDLINIDNGQTTRRISQQVLIDKGGTNSVTSMNIELTNFRNEISKAFAFQNSGEMLGKIANVYINFQEGSHPEDSIAIFRGFIDEFATPHASLVVGISHSENIKRQDYLSQFVSETTDAITAVDTTLELESVFGLYEAQDILTSYLRIADEIVRVISIDELNNTVEVDRGEFGSIAVDYDAGESVTSFYTFSGLPIPMALKIMLSLEGNEYFPSDEQIKSFEYVNESLSINNAIIFDSVDIKEATGLTVGDLIEVTGTTINAGFYKIASFGTNEDGSSYIEVEEELESETDFEAEWSYKSKYNVLSTGLGMYPNEVDVEGMELEESTYLPNFTEMLLPVDDTIDDAKDFIDKQIYFPFGLYNISRKARSSCKFTAPPLSIEETPVLGVSNIINIDKLKPMKSVHKYFYNNVAYKYGKDFINGKYLAGRLNISNDSYNRIRSGSSQFTVIADGLLRNSETAGIIDRISNRFLDRYKFSATLIDKIEVNYSTGFNLETGDIVYFGGSDIKITDPDTGEIGLPFKLYEVINREFSIIEGRFFITILETGFGTNGRFAVFSPASYIGTGSTTEKLILRRLLDDGLLDFEREKWESWQGLRIQVRSEDWAFCEETNISGFDQSNANALLIDPPLSVAPVDGYIVEIAPYDSQGNSDIAERAKLKYSFKMAQIEIDLAISESQFEADTTYLSEGQKIYIHSDDFTRDSSDDREVEIDDITGNVITLNKDLEFIPQAGDKIESLDFPNLDDGYRII